jgi:tRNA wybutosine-synthesizing protein 3
MDSFNQRKRHILTQLTNGVPDRSPKGFVDEQLLPLIEHVNHHADYVTTSSCSGRCVVYADPLVHATKQKGGEWLLVSHDPLPVPESDDALHRLLFGTTRLIPTITTQQPLVYFKFEPMILHIQCRTLEHARRLVDIGMAAGFRNSGMITTSKRHMVQLRHTMHLDVPIGVVCTHGISLVVPDTYLHMLVRLGNTKMQENEALIQRLFTDMQQRLDLPFPTPPPKPPRKQASKRTKSVGQEVEEGQLGELFGT